MLRRTKRDVLGQLPEKRRQVVRLPKPKPEDWPDKRGRGKADEKEDAEVSEDAGELALLMIDPLFWMINH